MILNVVFAIFYLSSINSVLNSQSVSRNIIQKMHGRHALLKIAPTNYNIYNECNYLATINANNFNYANSKLCDLKITVKTSKKYHETRLRPLIDTWFKFVSSKVNKT